MSDVFTYKGTTYKVSEWLTVGEYAQKYSIPYQTLTSQVKRRSMPEGAVLEIPAWGLKLIRDQVHPIDPPGRKPRE